MKRLTRALIRLPLLAAAASSLHGQTAVSPARPKPEYHGRFIELPVGAVKPLGWIERWLRRQAGGMTGHPEHLAYPYDTCMFAGKIPPPSVKHGETWWPYEQAAYFVDGAVRLHLQTGDARVGKIADASLDYLLANSTSDQLGASSWGWPNAVVGRALTAHHSATADARTLDVLTTYLTGPGPRFSRDGFVVEQALYVYGQTGDERLLNAARAACDRYFFNDPRSFSHIDKLRGDKPLREHGVTAAEQLKLLPLLYAYTGDPQTLALAELAYRKIEADSLMPDGGMVSSENLGTTAFNSLHESCDITDWSWSIGCLLIAGGRAHWADLIEQTTFNALPGAVTKNFQQLQYFSAANQILASNTACTRIAPTRMSYRAAHDTECCSGNINRAMPNYVARMWMGSKDGPAATLLGPCRLETTIAGQPVTITEDTDYPFTDSVTFKISTTLPIAFTLSLRIPEWCDTATITVNGAPPATSPKPGTFAAIKREFRDGDTVVLRLPMAVRLRAWFGGHSVSVQRGPLVYSLPIAEQRVESREDPEPIRRILKGNNIQGFSAVEFLPVGEWRYGLDRLRTIAPENFRVIESPIRDNPFEAGQPPVRIELPLRSLPQWAAAWKPVLDPTPDDPKLAPKNPASLPDDDELRAPAAATTLALVPYGSTHLRLTTFPLIGSAAPATAHPPASTP